MSFSIRLTPDERNSAESYANIHGISLSDAFRKALFEEIPEPHSPSIVRQNLGGVR